LKDRPTGRLLPERIEQTETGTDLIPLEFPHCILFHRDAYKRVSDTLGIERYQSVPLYLPEDTLTAERCILVWVSIG